MTYKKIGFPWRTATPRNLFFYVSESVKKYGGLKNRLLRSELTGENPRKKIFLSFYKEQKKPALQLPTIKILTKIISPGRNGYIE